MSEVIELVIKYKIGLIIEINRNQAQHIFLILLMLLNSRVISSR